MGKAHVIHHVLVYHFLDPHEVAFAALLGCLFWGCTIGAPLALILGHWWTAADLALVLMILFRLFGGLGHSH